MIPNPDEKLKPLPLLLYGLQWWAVSMPSVVIMGLVFARLLHAGDSAAQILSLQKLFLITGLATGAQVLVGHRLPVVTGPASVLLIGVVAAGSASPDSATTSIFLGGIAMAVVAASGLLRRLAAVFTLRILVLIMLLIPFTLMPSILQLVFQEREHDLFNFLFAPAFLAFLLIIGKMLRGVWKATTIIWAMLAGTMFVFCIHGFPVLHETAALGQAALFTRLEFEPGVFLSFLLCILAMIINEISSVQAVGQMVRADNLQERGRRGVLVNGLATAAAGLTGVLGVVDYTTSSGFIASTKCASRFAFVPAAALLVLCALFPSVLGGLLCLPGSVLGMVLFYVMATQLAAGLQMAVRERAVATFEDGLCMGIPLMLSVMVAFMPGGVAGHIPGLFRPIFTNPFVVGVCAALVLEHGYNRWKT